MCEKDSDIPEFASLYVYVHAHIHTDSKCIDIDRPYQKNTVIPRAYIQLSQKEALQ